jgi:hypothetical protein
MNLFHASQGIHLALQRDQAPGDGFDRKGALQHWGQVDTTDHRSTQ